MYEWSNCCQLIAVLLEICFRLRLLTFSKLYARILFSADVDECVTRTADCTGPDDICINTRGSYKCETVTCPKGFVRAASANNKHKSVNRKSISYFTNKIYRYFEFVQLSNDCVCAQQRAMSAEDVCLSPGRHRVFVCPAVVLDEFHDIP